MTKTRRFSVTKFDIDWDIEFVKWGDRRVHALEQLEDLGPRELKKYVPDHLDNVMNLDVEELTGQFDLWRIAYRSGFGQ
ncbi:hypothetical protein MBM_08318 [Drepanopeziza brunnea f. sp. 'multigermtubi' MB_m1]|uniref:Uncharacterized protein n=2 Tax=Drepanopeziza brunnea f. sp. 'multigermtubi' TaxID=698441 RepID=K1W8T2_MARBU|nr:uncharacterized protein MBM_08318 [Drepanopeziza brunnea f. sp. 'multigermtubi' MB_m1]EKD13600.1 hypothetical protein MBM_08318 [Drepanopeziza brunnea f. sp. 'multigermtubi' MB_m1]